MRAFAKRIGARSKSTEFDELVTAIYRLRLARKLPLAWLSPVYGFAVDSARNGP